MTVLDEVSQAIGEFKASIGDLRNSIQAMDSAHRADNVRAADQRSKLYESVSRLREDLAGRMGAIEHIVAELRRDMDEMKPVVESLQADRARAEGVIQGAGLAGKVIWNIGHAVAGAALLAGGWLAAHLPSWVGRGP